MNDSIYTLAAIPVFFALIGLELFYQHKTQKKLYRLNDTLTNLNIGIGSLIFSLLTRGIEFGAYLWVAEHAAIFHLKPNIFTFILILFVFDLCFYWAHRFGHEMNFFWGAHVVHHQSEEYNLSVALRQSWIHSFLAFIFFLPIAFLGVDIVTLGIVLSVNSFYQFWIHTKAIKKLPRWFEFIFNTPSHHRVHHGVNPKYIDKNHAGMFIIWDRMFGTFQAEEEEPVYGVTVPLKSWNPVWSNIEYYVNMFKNGRKMQSIADKLKLIVAKPGWLPEDLGGPVEVKEIDKTTYQKFDDNASRSLNVYVLTQFILILGGACAFIYYFQTLSLIYKVLGFGMLLLSFVICSAIMEQKSWVKYAEYGRIGFVLLGLNSLYYFTFFNWFYVTLVISIVLSIYFISWFTLNIFYQTSLIDLVRKTAK